MLTVEDCIHFSDADASEIDAIAEHEHVDSAVACELAANMNQTLQGRRQVIQFMVDDIAHAEEHRQFEHASELRHALRQFVSTHSYV